MGFYVEPRSNISHKDWLRFLDAKPISEQAIQSMDWNPEEHCPVCYMDQGTYQTIGIAYNPREFRRFKGRSGLGGGTWYLVPKEALYPHLHGQKITWKPFPNG